MIELNKMEGMIVVSNNNFKDDFEKNRQSINPDEHQTELKEDDKTNENKKLTLKTVYLITQINNFLQCPTTKKTQRQQLIKANNKTTNIKNSDAKTTEGSLDDRYDEAQLQQQHDKSQQQNKTEKQSQDNRMKDGKDAAIVNGTSESQNINQNQHKIDPALKLNNKSVNQKVRNQNRQQTKIKKQLQVLE